MGPSVPFALFPAWIKLLLVCNLVCFPILYYFCIAVVVYSIELLNKIKIK